MWAIITKETNSRGVVVKRLVNIVFDSEEEAINSVSDFLYKNPEGGETKLYKIIKLSA